MEKENKKIPIATKKRFPLYLRALLQLQQNNVERIRSYQLGKMIDVEANTVRRDFMYVNHKGKSAYGYDVNSLINAFNEELGTDKNNTKIVLIGVGNIGSGLLKYNYIPSHVGQIICAFDSNIEKINTSINNVPIYDYKDIKKLFPKDCKIVILAIPSDNIDSVVNDLVLLKVKAIINFSDGIPRKRTGIKIHQIDLSKIVSEIIYDLKLSD